MNFKAAYCGLTLALVIAACGPSPEVTKATTADEAAAAIQSSQMNMAAAMGAAAGGANNPTMSAFASNIDKIADAMGTVKDEASARAAAQSIAAANVELEKLKKDLDGMSDQQKAAAAMAIAPQLMAVQQKIATATMNIVATDPKLMEIVSDELAKMPSMN